MCEYCVVGYTVCSLHWVIFGSSYSVNCTLFHQSPTYPSPIITHPLRHSTNHAHHHSLSHIVHIHHTHTPQLTLGTREWSDFGWHGIRQSSTVDTNVVWYTNIRNHFFFLVSFLSQSNPKIISACIKYHFHHKYTWSNVHNILHAAFQYNINYCSYVYIIYKE